MSVLLACTPDVRAAGRDPLPAGRDPLPAGRDPLGHWWPGRERLVADFRIDRRRADRWLQWGSATLLSLGANLGLLVELENLECAPWWLSGTSETPITVGTRVSVGFSDPCSRASIAVVMRCERAGAGGRYRITARFDGTSPC